MDFDLNESLNSEDFTHGNQDSDEGQSYEYRGEDPESVQTLIVNLEAKLEVGNIYNTAEEVYLVFCEYGRCRGFSVRKGCQRYFPNTKEIRMKEYVCSCWGRYEEKKGIHRLMDYRKQIYRTGCKARLRIYKGKDGSWNVAIFNKDHNHELVPHTESYLLRSARNLSLTKKTLVEALNLAGIGVSRAYRFMANEAGGPQNVGITKRDAYNHMHDIRRSTKVENGDANALMQHLIQKSHSEPFFYWNVQADDEGRLMNFFFRDSRCLIDYEIFGDVLSVDTTYRTNRYDLIAVPFVGINHHMSNVMFGLAFLSNETTESFKWLFTTFLESMHGQEPQVIFSDQCQALMNGIDSSFRSARHRLCQWHINRNAPSHFGSLNGNKAFKRMWHKCMNDVDTEAEFEECWSELIQTYALQGNRWFANMYKLRMRWASVFTHSYFSAGLHATSRSEGTNKTFKDLCSAKSSLSHFVKCYEQIQADWRVTESADDARDIGVPGPYISHNPLLMDASRLFTRKVFKAFEEQLANCVNVYLVEPPRSLSEIDMQYRVSSQPSMSRIRRVQYNSESQIASCSCRMWETTGVLCKHILRIYLEWKVLKLPKQCILPRWCKNAKLRHWEYINRCSKQGVRDRINGLSFVNYVMRMTYEVLNTSKHDEECRQFVLEGMKSLQEQVTTFLRGRPCVEHDQPQSKSSKQPQVRDPRRSKRTTTGDDAREGHWCSGKNKRNKKKSSAPAKYADVWGPDHAPEYPDSNWFSCSFYDIPFNVSQHSVHDNFSTPRDEKLNICKDQPDVFQNFAGSSGKGDGTRI